MKIRYITIIVLIIFSMAQINFSEPLTKKDPLLGGVLSWYMPGLGQFYAKQYLKGSIYWVVENALFVSALLTIADLNFGANKDIGFQFSIKPKEYVSQKQKTIALTLGLSYVAFHIFNIIDAIQSVKTYNRQLMMNNAKVMLEYYQIADNQHVGIHCKF